MALLYLEIAVPTCNLLVMSPHNVAKTSMCVCVCVCVYLIKCIICYIMNLYICITLNSDSH